MGVVGVTAGGGGGVGEVGVEEGWGGTRWLPPSLPVNKERERSFELLLSKQKTPRNLIKL